MRSENCHQMVKKKAVQLFTLLGIGCIVSSSMLFFGIFLMIFFQGYAKFIEQNLPILILEVCFAGFGALYSLYLMLKTAEKLK